MGVSMHSLVRRIPMALGPIIGGFCIAMFGEKDGIRFAFIISFIFAFVAIFLQHYLIEDTHIKQLDNVPCNPFHIFAKMSPSLKSLLVSDILIRFCEQIPYAFIVVWCMKNIGISGIKFGLLTTIEMVTAILIYIPVAYFADKAKGKKIFVTITFIFFSAFPIVIMFSSSMLMLAFAFLIRGLKEFGEPTRKALILDLADTNSKGTTYGAYYLIRDTIVSIAAFSGGILWIISPKVNFITASLFGFIGVIYFIKYCKE
jgi:MFS family permease